MKRNRNQIAIIMLSIIMLLSIPITVSAATGRISFNGNKYIQCYTLKSSGKVCAYTNSSLKTKKSNWWIDCAADECYILKADKDAIYVSYPSQAGRSKAWFRRSDFTTVNLSKSFTTAKASTKITTYRRSDGKKSYGYIGKGDIYYILTQSGNYQQVIYPLSSRKWKMGWIKKNMVNNENTKNKNKNEKIKSTTTNTIKTYTFNPTSIDDFLKQEQQIFSSMLGINNIGQFISNGEVFYYPKKVITERKILATKKVPMKITVGQGPLLPTKTIYVKLPTKIQYTIHTHKFNNEVSTSVVGTWIVGLINQKWIITQTCDCGETHMLSWDIPDFTVEKVRGGVTYQVTSISRNISH